MTCSYGSGTGSQCGRYIVSSRPRARHGYMFSTAITTPVSTMISAMRRANWDAYPPCQRNGGWATTVRAPTARASSTERSILDQAVPHTCCVNSRVGAWIESIRMPVRSASVVRRSASWLYALWVTITSTPS